MMTTWRKELDEAFKDARDWWEDVVSSTLSDVQLDEKFDSSYGCVEGCAFTVWTHRNVYFPWRYDGSEGVARVSRNPDDDPTPHVGGGVKRNDGHRRTFIDHR
jgi:hypothetical protein